MKAITLEQAAALAAARFESYRAGRWAEAQPGCNSGPLDRCDPSHAAVRALQDANRICQLDFYGVEGDAGLDVTYLNAGDTYAQTILFIAGEFIVSALGDIVEAAG